MKTRSSQRFLKLRVTLIMLFFIGIFSVIMLRSYQLQIIEQERCIELLHKQYRKYVTLPPKRGTIYDREKRELAVSLDVDSVYVHPAEVKDAKAMAKQLSPILKSSYQFVQIGRASCRERV